MVIRKPNYWILEGHEPKPVDVEVWSEWFENRALRRVAQTEIGTFMVSTVFLGLDHGWNNDRPVLFETMVFPDNGNDLNECYCERCCTWDEAEEMHRRAVAWAGCCGPYSARSK